MTLGEKESILSRLALEKENCGPQVIGGHDIYSLHRFSEDVEHMVVVDVLDWECAVGGKGERVRVFLTADGYQAALDAVQGGHARIIKHAKVVNGYLYYDAPEILV